MKFNFSLVIATAITLTLLLANCHVLDFIGPSSVTEGQTVTVHFKLRNTLANNLDNFDGVKIGLSTDSKFNESDLELASVPVTIRSGQAKWFSATVTIPPLNSGKYYWVVHTYSDTYIQPVQVTGIGNQTDLMATNLFFRNAQEEVIVNDKLHLFFNLKNTGASSGNFHTTYFLSSDRFLGNTDVQIYDGFQTSLSSNQERYYSGWLRVPSNYPIGRSFVIVKADYRNRITDKNEATNTIVKEITIKPASTKIKMNGPKGFATQQMDLTAESRTIQLEGESLKLTHIEEVLLEEGINLFPNPAVDKANLQFSTTQKTDLTITIVDNAGRLIQSFSEQDFQGDYSKELELGNLLPGNYFVVIQSDKDKIITKQLIVN